MTVAVISSIYGGYDQPIAQPVQDVECDWIMVSDQPKAPGPWRVVHEPRPHLHPRLAAKVAKCRPDLYSDADVLVWIDGNFAIHGPGFVSWCVSTLDGGPLAQHRSLYRQSVTEEAQVAAPMLKYAGLPVVEQAASYLGDGHPDEWGLWATGLIVRTSQCPDFGSPWLVEQMRWTYEDQLSQAPILRRMGLWPANIEVNWHRPDRFHLESHRDGL